MVGKKLNTQIVQILLFLSTACLTASCSPEHISSQSQSSGGGAAFIRNPEPDPVLRANAKTVFEANCINCHGTGGSNTPIFESPGGSVDMDALAENLQYIQIGQPDQSYLNRAIYQVSMPSSPPANTFLSDTEDQDAISAWIEDIGIPSGNGGGSNAPTFTEIESEILAPKCYTCHESGLPEFSDYDSVLTSIVIPNNPDSALLRVTQDGTMPQGQPDLMPNEILKIEEWIMAGALNN